MKKKVLEKLDTVSWISPDTKQAAIDKIQKLDGKFLGSEIFFNYTLLQQRYRGVTVPLFCNLTRPNFGKESKGSAWLLVSGDHGSNPDGGEKTFNRIHDCAK